MLKNASLKEAPMAKNSFNILSLFSGAGGLDLGFRGGFDYLNKTYKKHNFNLVFANDIDKNACETFRMNFGHDIFCGDVRELLSSLFITDSKVDILLGGFPCQDFSHAGKRRGFNSERGVLYQSMADMIEKMQPMVFIAENVKGLLTMNNGASIMQIVREFEAKGYHVRYKLLNTANFEVPQNRERVIIVGTKKEFLPPFDFDFPVFKQRSVKDAIADLADIKEGEFANHYWSKAKKNNGQGNNAVDKDAPAPTMRAEHHGNIEFHYDKKRRLSAREAARIQSFPDDFIFYPSTSSAYKQIGNAVPPVFAWHIANAISQFLQKNLRG